MTVTTTPIHGTNIGKDFKAMGRNLVGRRSKTCEDEFGNRQDEPMAALEQAAAELGADAVVSGSLGVDALGNGNRLLVSVTGSAVVVKDT